MSFNLQEAQSCSEIPACRGPEVLAILVKIDPISAKESEEYPPYFPEGLPGADRKILREVYLAQNHRGNHHRIHRGGGGENVQC
jgi:hypothetical protein